jgi:NAD(P)H-dependent FMN reductase
MLIDVITGTTRAGRFSERVATWVLAELGARRDFEVESVDRVEWVRKPISFVDRWAGALAAGRD